MARKRRKPWISREELLAMHEAVLEMRPPRGWNYGSEGYSLLCALGACLGNWPRVRGVKVEQLRDRYLAFQTILPGDLRLQDQEALP
jgi:hypothetical protein